MNIEIALTYELRMLAYSALLCLLLWIPYILAEIKVRGLNRAVGYPTAGPIEFRLDQVGGAIHQLRFCSINRQRSQRKLTKPDIDQPSAIMVNH